MESSINARVIDFAKFGRLFLKNGNWNGKQIISEDWILESTQPDFAQDRTYYREAWFKDKNIYYKYFWYSYPRNDGTYDFYAAGHLSQYIYVSPSKNLIIVPLFHFFRMIF
jgi:CubicO group peptidase (beta-lactamase class C family)